MKEIKKKKGKRRWTRDDTGDRFKFCVNVKN